MKQMWIYVLVRFKFIIHRMAMNGILFKLFLI